MMRLVWARGFPALPSLVAPTPMGAFGGQQSHLSPAPWTGHLTTLCLNLINGIGRIKAPHAESVRTD